jgi:ATP-dependent DNA helicase DinG
MAGARRRDPDPPTLTGQVEVAFGDDGRLSKSVAGYEPRSGQRRMAAAVATLLESGGTLLAEAGTGTGKTLAYLVPGILSGQRLLVSTGTKNLQEQIFFKDLPALRQALGVPFTATLMKGRGNYLCLHRWEAYRDGVEGGVAAHGRLIESGDRVFVPVIDEWLARTKTGDRAELADLPEDLALWREVAAEASTCLGSECPRHAECFVTLMRQRAAEADVVIVNHHLLCADAAVRQSAYGEVIPGCATLVVDEAHQLEDVATQYFGVAVSGYRLDELLRDAARLALPDLSWTRDVGEAVERVRDRGDIFFATVIAGAPRPGAPGATASPDGRLRYSDESIAWCVDAGVEFAAALEGLERSLAGRGAATPPSTMRAAEGAGNGSTTDDSRDEVVAALERRAAELRRDLRFLLRADDPDFVYFLERRGRGLALRAAPVDVSRIVREQVLERFRSVLLTSATLAVDGSFAYVRARLGLGQPGELRVASEFDYTRQTLLYLPRRMPSPKSPEFADAVAREATQLLQRTHGRAFVLFTSYSVMRRVQAVLEMSLTFPILVQGTAPRSLLIDEFRTTPHAVLLGTSSFWQGVDVAGDALSCVIIDKLPFASPGDPVTGARIDAIRTAGGDPFAEYQVPLAILMLQQGLGRLIRHRTDRGVLAVLDPRLRTMGYGRRFLASLPPAPMTHDLGAVERFFA